MSKRNRAAKNAAKRLRNVTVVLDPAQLQAKLDELSAAISRGETTAAEVDADARQSPPAAAALLREAQRLFQCRLLHQYKSVLQSKSSSLSERGCWDYYHASLPSATAAGVADEFRDLVLQAAHRFATGKKLKLTRCHRNGQPPLPPGE